MATGATTTKETIMKRSDLILGQAVALGTANDWDESTYHIERVTVVDTRGFFARRAGRLASAEVTLEDGTNTTYYVPDSTKSNCLVRNAHGELRLVSLGHLRGEYTEVHSRVAANQKQRAQAAQQLANHKEQVRARTTAAAQALKDLGVNLGYVSGYDEALRLGPTALEQILALLQK